ncbi:patatin-like phospholipase family protein [Nocardioides immobilis]|nr:patatin-like phospholipase family protein [Nocardioides immobilis]
MESSGYAEQRDEPRAGKGARMDVTRVVQRGRWREFRRTLLIAAGLLVLQQPLRWVVDAPWFVDRLDSVHEFNDVVPARMSLIVDVMLVVAYVFVAYRAFGLLRSSRAEAWPEWAGGDRSRIPPPLVVNKVGLALVLAGAGLDLWEDLRLWVLFGQVPHDLTLGFDEVFTTGDGGHGYTLVMWAVVAAGFGFQAVSFIGFPRASADGRPALAELAKLDKGGTVICCSGGGIRSAAFSLGGLQALTEHDIYPDARAVVGVSGGGYVGAAYHVLRWNPVDSPPRACEVGEKDWGSLNSAEPAFAPGSPEMQWLRRHTQYVLNGIRIAAQGALSLMFGIAVNLLLMAAVLGGTAWVLAWLMLASGRLTTWQGTAISGELADDWWFLGWVWLVPAAGVAVFLVEKATDRLTTIPWGARNFLRILTGYLLIGGLAMVALLVGVPALVAELAEYAATSDSMWAGLLHQLGFVPTEVCMDALASTDACGVSQAVAEATTPSDAVAGTSPATVPGVSIATVVASILAVLASAKSAASDKQEAETATRLSGLLSKVWTKIKDPVVPWAALVAVALIAITVLLRWVAVLVADPDLISKWEYAGWFAVLLLLTKLITDANRTSLHHFFRERISYAFLVRRNGNSVQPVPYKRALRFSEALPPAGRGPQLVACAVANVSDEEFVPSRRGCVPFVFDHRQIGLTDRLLPAGAARRVSATYEFAADARYRDATIPAAVAMSAAAFSPLAGRENVRLGPYRAVLALGNARLGVWLPNPLWVDELGLVRRLVRLRRWDEATWIAAGLPDGEYSRLSARTQEHLDGPVDRARVVKDEAVDPAERQAAETALHEMLAALPQPDPWMAVAGELVRAVFKKPGVSRLAKEAFGKASVYDRFLYVTDGGHYDNLGLIEALRRKPDRIFVLDASNDKEDTFRTLGRAIATARMDLDCEVEMDPRGMRRLSETRSGAAWCRGRYEFADRSGEGTIYLAKAILLNDLSWDIEAYSADNLDFPRTSTGNQLYSEFDFEAYRALGTTAVRKLLASDDYRA